MNSDAILQWIILISNFGVNILLTRKGILRSSAFILGAMVQPLWMLEAYHHHQYVLMLYSIANLGVWVYGIICDRKDY